MGWPNIETKIEYKGATVILLGEQWYIPPSLSLTIHTDEMVAKYHIVDNNSTPWPMISRALAQY